MAGTCAHVRDRLEALLEGELDDRAQDAGAVRMHLAACEDCRREFDALQRTKAALHCWQTPAVNPQVSVAFAERLAAHAAQPSRGQRLWGTVWQRVALATGAVGVIAVLAYSLVTPPRRGTVVSHPTPAAPRSAPVPAAPGSAPHRLADSAPSATGARNRIVVTARENAAETDETRQQGKAYVAPPPPVPEATVAVVNGLAEAEPLAATWAERPDEGYTTEEPGVMVAASPEDLVLAAWMEME